MNSPCNATGHQWYWNPGLIIQTYSNCIVEVTLWSAAISPVAISLRGSQGSGDRAPAASDAERG